MEDELTRFTEAEFEEALAATLKKLVAPSCVKVCRRPRAVLLGGQSGAGKTALHMVCKEKLEQGAVVVNGDEYRSSHPRYYELDEAYGPEAVAHTAAWAGRMTEALIGALSAMKYNLIIEGTLRTSEVPVKTATLLRARGYDVSLALMAVKPEISLISCQIRYELMRIAGTIPRATDPNHHNKIVQDIVGNLDVLEQTGLFDEICLYARSRERLYPVEGEARTASQALREVLFGPWTGEERAHYAHLEEELADLKGRS